MRRGRRERKEKIFYSKKILISLGIVLFLIFASFVITFIIYNNKLKNSSYSSLTTDKIADLVPNNDGTVDYIEEASVDIGKSIEDAINKMEEKNSENIDNKNNTNNTKSSENSKSEFKENTNKVSTEVKKIKDPEFIMPVEGEKIRGYAKDTLVYSDTLEEWITHLGIDIKADRTSVVKAAEDGKIISIKNDPRYGLTIIIEHVNGFKTIYSNLLSTEFVKEGESVKKGESIGTVGNSASFEILDEPHLHFEILKNDINIDPSIYVN